jgi:hypothetical protein
MQDDNDSVTPEWVYANFPSMGVQYSARRLHELPNLVWLNRFERFTLYDDPQTHLRTRGDVRRLVAALGCNKPLNAPPRT